VALRSPIPRFRRTLALLLALSAVATLTAGAPRGGFGDALGDPLGGLLGGLLDGGVARAAAATTTFEPVPPCRLFDSRRDGGLIPRDRPVTIRVAGACGVPGSDRTAAAALTLTVTQPTGDGYVVAGPAGSPRPSASHVNVRRGQTVANGAVVRLGADGAITLYASTATHLVVDVSGAFVHASSATAGRFVPVESSRVLDTRIAPAQPLRARTPRVVDLGAVVPTGATAAAVTLTITQTAGPGHLVAWADGDPRPGSSVVNADGPGQTRAATVFLPARAGRIQVEAAMDTHLVVDVTGWFTGPDAPDSTEGLFVPLSPQRSLDTRIDRRPLYAGGVVEHRPATAGADETLPAGAALVNLTAVGAVGPGHLTIWAAGRTRPGTSTLNTTSRAPVANLAVWPLSTRGGAIGALRSTHVIVDSAGWFVGAPGAATLSAPGNPVPPLPRVLAVGDSSMSGIRWIEGAATALRGMSIRFDGESCRRLVGTSCGGREGRRPPNAVESILAAPGRYEVVVIQTGYNDWAANFPDAIHQVVGAARAKGAHTVLWLTYREAVSYTSPSAASNAAAFVTHNAHLRAVAASGVHPELVLVEFDALTRPAASWFTRDGVHFTQTGAYGVADIISRAVAAALLRPCDNPANDSGDRACVPPESRPLLTDPVGRYTNLGDHRPVACTVVAGHLGTTPLECRPT
jgi:hypothetical protein